MSLYFCLKLNKKFSLDQESLTAVGSYFIHYMSLLGQIIYKWNCYFWKHLNSLLLIGRKNQKQANQSFLGWFFFFQMSGCPTTLLIIRWTLPTPTQFACFPISYLLWISQDVVHVASHFFKTYNCFNITVLNKLSLVLISFCQELIMCCFVGLHNGNIRWATCCWNSKEYYFLLKYTCTLLLVFLCFPFLIVWLDFRTLLS